MKRKSPVAGICSALLLFTLGSAPPAQADTMSGRAGFARMGRAAAMAVAAAAALIFNATVHAAEPPETALPGLDAALGELRRGGLVIYFRHGPTDHSGAGDAEADMARCETQRNLSAGGRDQAVQIGKAFRALAIPVGTVTTSPFCRCKETASLAFGRFTISNDLYFAINADATETVRLAESLRRMLATPPATGTNAVIVSHTANLREAAGIWPKPEGVAYVFRPLPGGRFEAVAKVAPQDWPRR